MPDVPWGLQGEWEFWEAWEEWEASHPSQNSHVSQNSYAFHPHPRPQGQKRLHQYFFVPELLVIARRLASGTDHHAHIVIDVLRREDLPFSVEPGN